MQRVTSPLRYPGSKVRIAEMVAGLLEQNLLVGSHLYEPFAGGSAVSLALLANNFVTAATWVERDPMIYAFWVTVRDNPEALIERMMAGKITLTAWSRMLRLRAVEQPTEGNLLQLAYAGLFFNRTCFSGIIGAGPIGGMQQSSAYKIDCRFNKQDLAAAIRGCSEIIRGTEIIFGDGISFLQDHCLSMPSHSVVYIDPPYVANGHKLYRHYFTQVDHERLASAVSDLTAPWLVSYDKHELIRQLYVGEQTKFVKTYQSLKGSRFVKEILILSSDFVLPPLQHRERSRRDRGRAELSDHEY